MDIAAEPIANAPRSTVVKATCPSYLGGGRLRTEKDLLDAKAAYRMGGGSRKQRRI